MEEITKYKTHKIVLLFLALYSSLSVENITTLLLILADDICKHAFTL